MTERITCKNCGHGFTGNYCNNCGEKVLHAHDKTVGHFFEDAVHFITHFDGKFFTTLKTMFKTPGKLSLDYSQGIRQPYFKPVSFFLLLVVLYLLFPMFQGLNMPLQAHTRQAAYGHFAAGKIDHYLQSHPGATIDTLAEQFAKKSEKASKLLLFIIIPLTALPLWLMTFRRKPYFYDHLVLATEINSLFLLLTFLLFPLVLLALQTLSSWLHWHYEPVTYTVLGIISYSLLAVYEAIALRRFYQYKWHINFLFVIVLLGLHTLIVYVVYKFILFVTAFALLH
jgi:hypothetical protein